MTTGMMGLRVMLVSALWVACDEPTPATQGASPSPSASVRVEGPAVSFAESTPLQLAAGEQVTLVARTDAAGATIRFALQGDFADASLSRSRAIASATGEASVELRAPRRASAFRVRASIEGGGVDERSASVASAAPASLRISALYTGDRATSEWEARIALGEGSCTQPPAGVGGMATASKEQPLSLAEVPSGQRLRVWLRAGALVAGCAEVAPLDPGEQRSVEVLVKNMPASTAPDALELSMNFGADAGAWSKTLGLWTERFRGAYLGGQTDDPQAARALLDTMMILAPSKQRAALLAARSEQGWDGWFSARFAQAGGPQLTLTRLDTAREQLRKAPPSLRGQLRAQSATTLLFAADQLLALGSTDDLPGRLVSWTLAPDDTLQVSSQLVFWPTQMLSRAIETTQSDPPFLVQLRAATDCTSTVAALLADQGSAPPGCDGACLAALCDEALGVMWKRARATDELSGAQAKLAFTASGAASLDEGARIVGFAGSWVGLLEDVQVAGASTPLSGVASATPLP